MLNWLLPPHIITLTGKIQPAGIRGIGISLELTDSQSKRQLASYTLWQDEFDPDTPPKPDATDPKPYLRLAEPAAVWAMFSYFQDRWEHGSWWQPHRRLCLSGTSDWQSYALLQAGTNWVRDKDREKGRQLYHRALTKDPKNYGALTNLASLAMQEETTDPAVKRKQYALAAKQLTDAREAIRCAGNRLRDPAWYIASYRLGIAESELERLDRAAAANGMPVPSSPPPSHADESVKILGQTFDEVTLQWEAYALAHAWGPFRHLQLAVFTPFLWLWRHVAGIVGGMLWCLVCLVASLLVWMLGGKERSSIRQRVRAWRWWCAPLRHWGAQKIGDEVSLEFLNTMRFGIGFSYARARAEFEGFTDDVDIVKEAEASGGAGLTAREQYNLACYYAQRAAQYDAAAKKAKEAHLVKEAEKAEKHRCTSFKNTLKALESGLGLPSGVADRWPLRDEALRPLREDATSKPKFDELLKAYNGIPEKEPDPLAELRGIGGHHAGQLKEKGYGTPELLSSLANDFARFVSLVHSLGISPTLALRWVRLAQLYQVADKQSGAVNLLELAGVETLDDLARADSDALTTTLAELNQDAKLVEPSPTTATIRKWIVAAKDAAR
jgi:hypothetical protein